MFVYCIDFIQKTYASDYAPSLLNVRLFPTNHFHLPKHKLKQIIKTISKLLLPNKNPFYVQLHLAPIGFQLVPIFTQQKLTHLAPGKCEFFILLSPHHQNRTYSVNPLNQGPDSLTERELVRLYLSFVNWP